MVDRMNKAVTRIALAVVMADGEVTNEEKAELIESLSNFGVSEAALEDVLGEAVGLERLLAEVEQDVLLVGEKGSHELKAHLFKMACDLTVADGAIAEMELKLLELMKTTWNMQAK